MALESAAILAHSLAGIPSLEHLSTAASLYRQRREDRVRFVITLARADTERALKSGYFQTSLRNWATGMQPDSIKVDNIAKVLSTDVFEGID